MNTPVPRLLALLVLVLCGCLGEEPETYRLRAELEPRFGSTFSFDTRWALVLQGEKRDAEGRWVPTLDVPPVVYGFDFEWGVMQTVEVRVEHHGSGDTQDAITHYRELERVLSREQVPAGTPFVLSFQQWSSATANPAFFARSGRTLTLGNPGALDGQTFRCVSDAVCDAIVALAQGTKPFSLEAQHDAPGTPPVLTGTR